MKPNIAIIFAGGAGKRMNAKSMPKQFLELHGKPILIYTLEEFQRNKSIDGIIIVMLSSHIDYTRSLVEKYKISKVADIVAGGETCQESIFKGIKRTHELYPENSTVLIHDGVRPLVDQNTIDNCIECVRIHGNAITVSPATETITRKGESGTIEEIIERSACQLAKAPQCFGLGDIYRAHLKSQADGLRDFIDSASLMKHYGVELYTVTGTPENIKITTPGDFYIFRAIVDAKENSQIWGL
ncbi:MAG: 2-C-methyl-D-erythritol 4-phosphate cytidylyltransferase [Clostridiales bacterium]|nr:2-C-methyl-D-erythritol 4-phosphate cytidylyltransferase [Clostridiales bacterium]